MEELKFIDRNLQSILELYPLNIKEAICIDPMSDGNKWIIHTDTETKIIRKVHVKPERMLFIAGAHYHLLNNGFPITNIQLTKNNGLCISTRNHSYIMYDRHIGTDLSYFDKNDLLKIMQTTGHFHVASKGYFPHEQSKKRSRLGNYHKLFQWKIQELKGNKMLAKANLDDTFSTLFLEYVDLMIDRAKQSLKELDEAPFQQWTEHFRLQGGFCQQEFKLSHFINIDGKPFMTELPSVTIDLPTRDLRIFLNKVMLKLGVWDSQLAIKMLQAYEGSHSLTEENYKVLWNDLRFPYHFCSLVHKYYLNQKPSWNSEKFVNELKLIIDMEISKNQFLQEFKHNVSQIKENGEKI